MHRETLVPLTSNQGGTPIFLVAPLAGSVQCYLELAKATAAPCIGLAARGVNGNAEPLTCIESIAASHIEAVRNHLPAGPYTLAGWSFGGLVAYEMALQLSREGVRTRVMLLDSDPPIGIGGPTLDEFSVLAGLCEELGRSANVQPPSEELLRSFTGAIARDQVLSWAREARVLGGDSNALQSLIAVYGASLRALRRYSPGQYAGVVQLFRTIQEGDSDPTHGWDRLCRVQLKLVPGDHYSILNAPHVASVAAELVRVNEVRVS